MNTLGAYLWGYSNWEAAHHSFRKFREFYPEGSIQIVVDNGGDVENYTRVANTWNASLKVNDFRVGRCGVFGDYANTSDGPENSRECWTKEGCMTWCQNIYDACVKSNSKFLIVLEEDSFVLRPISVLDKDFGIMVFEYNTTTMPPVLLDMISQVNGNTDIPLNIFGHKGYGAGGGFIVDCEKWIKSWDYFGPILELNYDMIKQYSKLIGWSDCIAQLVIMAGGYTVLQNPKYGQTWFDERPDLYPNFTHWRDCEVVDYLKDMEEIRKL